jgi:hypothetical protein
MMIIMLKILLLINERWLKIMKYMIVEHVFYTNEDNFFKCNHCDVCIFEISSSYYINYYLKYNIKNVVIVVIKI